VIAGDRVIGVTTELVVVTAEPVGGVPVAVAVLFTVPASTSACVNVYVFVHVVVAAGASCDTGQDTVPTFGSLTPTLVNVTLPVFFTRNEYAIVEPADMPDGAPADFVSVIAGVRVTGVVVELVVVTAAPVGGVPDAVAVLFTVPASTSAWVTVYVAVQVVEIPGSSEVTGHETVPTFESLTPTVVSVTLPVFFTTNVYGRVAPAALALSAPADLTNEIVAVRVIVVLVESVAVTAAPVGGVPEALAVLFTTPASASACVSV
jgi:hypothetical protein